MRQTLFVFFLLLATVFGRPASAFTPENGFWWNAAEAGRGFTIEIQDNFLFMIGYVYRQDGSSTFVTTQGLMQGNAAFQGVLDTFSNGQCIGCAYTGFPNIQPGASGPVSIIFTSETTATMTWNGGVTPLTRFNFYLNRPGSQSDPQIELMLGEWQNVLDYAEVLTDQYPFFGDVLVFDALDETDLPELFTGCRAENSVDGRCTQQAATNNEAVGYYDSGSDLHVIVVDNGNDFLVYVVETGTYQFDGFAKTCPFDQVLANCIASGVTDIPVRGFRSASRSFVQTGVGPNAAEPGPAKAPTQLPSVPVTAAKLAQDHSAHLLDRYGIDVSRLDRAALQAVAERIRKGR